LAEEAMRFFNLKGDKLFASVFTWLLGQPIREDRWAMIADISLGRVP